VAFVGHDIDARVVVGRCGQNAMNGAHLLFSCVKGLLLGFLLGFSGPAPSIYIIHEIRDLSSTKS
jgi:hypothetical protein